MAGIYLHIPFCKQACYYCDFHFSTNTSQKEPLVQAICQELILRNTYLNKQNIETIYFGGGTPSLLTRNQLTDLLSTIFNYYPVQSNPEITFEVNPDDITENYCEFLYSNGINRLSIGIQSFQDNILQSLNRAHSAHEALEAFEIIRKTGFNNITMDLMYGLPGATKHQWEEDLHQTIKLNPEHISAYGLTIEPQTVFGKKYKKNQLSLPGESFVSEQFTELINTLRAHGYQHYEISNFALPGYQSKHNSNYWHQVPYIGAGPGAHSYNGTNRQYNISNNAKYIRYLENNEIPATIEELGPEEHYEEYILTRLRTSSGINTNFIAEHFGINLWNTKGPLLNELKQQNLIDSNGEILYLKDKGKLLADSIIEKLI